MLDAHVRRQDAKVGEDFRQLPSRVDDRKAPVVL